MNRKRIELLGGKPKGVYQLLLFLPRASKTKVGKKGVFHFPRGYYVYTGSAKGGLKGRVSRHFKKDKRKFWHIDYLIPLVRMEDIVIRPQKNECYWNGRLSRLRESRIAVKGFGSSDCKCESHLLYFRQKPELNSVGECDSEAERIRV